MILPKVQIRKILYATDLSENALQAFAYAVSLAETYKAKITILHVLFEDVSMESSIISYVGQKKWDEIRNRNLQEARDALIGKKRDNVAIKEVLDSFCKTAQNGLTHQAFEADEVLVVRGNPVDRILKTCEDADCDIIVMGSHGHGTFVGAMIGSTAQRVVRRSQKPVLVVRIPE